MKDPTFETACTAEYRRIKRHTGCNTCTRRSDFKAWGKHLCKMGLENRENECNSWQYDVEFEENSDLGTN